MAQAYQVLLNANSQNPGNLANLSMMRDLVSRASVPYVVSSSQVC